MKKHNVKVFEVFYSGDTLRNNLVSKFRMIVDDEYCKWTLDNYEFSWSCFRGGEDASIRHDNKGGCYAVELFECELDKDELEYFRRGF